VLASAGNFRVHIDGTELALSQVRGLECGGPGTAGHVPADARVLLRRAITGDRQLYGLRPRHADERREVGEVVIEVWSADFSELIAAWALVGASPTRWRGPELDAARGGIAYEELELSYDRLEWRYPEVGDR
jgi:T4-like virus tail tube protein gp19